MPICNVKKPHKKSAAHQTLSQAFSAYVYCTSNVLVLVVATMINQNNIMLTCTKVLVNYSVTISAHALLVNFDFSY